MEEDKQDYGLLCKEVLTLMMIEGITGVLIKDIGRCYSSIDVEVHYMLRYN
jgi:hypothetical protein